MYKIKFFPVCLTILFFLICWGWVLPGLSQAFCSSVSGLSCMHLQGTGALLAQNQSGLSLLGLQDPGKPSMQSCFKTPGSVKDMAYTQGYAYLADSEQGLLVIDVRDPLACKQVSSYGKLQDQVKQISAWGNLLLVDLARSGLSVMDISDPARPRMIVALEDPILIKDLLLAQGYAYIVGSNGSLHVFDLQDPAQPFRTALLPLQTSPLQLGIAQDRLYLTTRQGRMHILDISSPDSPREIASIKIGKCNVAALAGDYIYLVDQEKKLSHPGHK
ncbi:MAG: LVIVD repeat-containing protein [Thermodesulfobacteriota bacterium]